MEPPSLRAKIQPGLRLFNRAQFFEAHEALEDVWRCLPCDQPSRRHVQGLVQLAVAFHHDSTGNRIGARSVLERGLRNLGGADSTFPELDLCGLRADIEPWRRYYEEGALRMSTSERLLQVPPTLPKIMGRKKTLPRR